MIENEPSYINITIPAFKEPDIISTLESLQQCDSEGINLNIDILINCSEKATEELKSINSKSYKDVDLYIRENNLGACINVELTEFPDKHAGVGLARKTLMDKVALRYKNGKINGIILALDADCTVKSNYLQAVKSFFANENYEAASIHFEHPIEDTILQKPIIEYEWHLRYFIERQQFCGFPFAYHTVGSSMACRSESYLAKGGMNKRKAGEDFYFLQKFIKDQVCGNISNTTVYPSGRVSDRVPFGTGRAIGKYEINNYTATTYNPMSFEILKKWNLSNQVLFDSEEIIVVENETLKEYLEQINFTQKVQEIRKNVSNKQAFYKRFYQFFDAFQLMKCLHFMRTEYPDVSIETAHEWFEKNRIPSKGNSLYQSLLVLREYQSKY